MIPGEKRHPTIRRNPDIIYTTPEQHRERRDRAVQERIARAAERAANALERDRE
jgi:hypothetical protein